MNKIIRVFPDTHLGNSHAGLASIAKTQKIDINDLKPGQFVVFLNKRQNAVKIFAAGHTICHTKTVDERRIDLSTIEKIPQYFSGGKFRYDEALKTALIAKIFRRMAA